MDQIRQLDDKILKLKQRKEQAEIKMARAMLKKVQMTLGKDTDVNLATLILEETWTRASEENKEVWRHKAGSFRRTDDTKFAQAKQTEPKDTNFADVASTEGRDAKLTEVTKAI